MLNKITVVVVRSPLAVVAIPSVAPLAVPDATQSSGAVTAPVREVKGAAAAEFVARWLRRNLPIALPALKTLELVVACRGSRQRGRTSGAQGQRLLAGRAMVDSVANPSAVAVVSRSTEQSM